MPTGARLLLVAAWAGTRIGGAEGAAEFAETSMTAPAPTQHQLPQPQQPQPQPADTQQQRQQYHHQQQRSLSEDAPVSWLSSPDLMARRSTQLSGIPNPFLPYVAPHFSHISHLKSYFF